MARKDWLILALAISGLVAAVPSAAMKIDPGLAAALVQKTPSEKVPVLLIFDGGARLDDDFVAGLQGVSASDRKTQVLAALKRNLRAGDNGALAVLAEPSRSQQVSDVHELYLAGALSFNATAAMVSALGALPDNGTLYHDGARVTHDAAYPVAPPFDKTQAAAVDTAWGVKYINAPKVWSQYGYDGAGVVVGHIDTGVWLAHPDLAPGIWRNPGEIIGNGIDDDGNGFIDDWRGWDFGDNDNNPDDDSAAAGHGTHTAGTVIGRGTDGTLTGVAPGARLMPVKVYNAAGMGGSLGVIWAAEQYCVENKARIITMSLGFLGSIPASFMSAERENCANIRNAGVLLVNSAGNSHADYDPPLELGLTARVPAPWNPLAVPYSSTGGVLTVGGTGYKNDTVYSGSSWGPAKWDDVVPYNDWPYLPGPGLTKPDIAAPAVGINSTTIGGGYSGDTWEGTSMACPHIAGVAALLLEKNPTLSPAGIDSIMEKSARDLGVAGKDNVFGSGLVDALAAFQATPLTPRADISWTRVLPDPLGDQVLDPGEVTPLAIELSNAGLYLPAVGVGATLAVVANPWVTVVDGAAVFPDLPVHGGTGSNAADPFTLAVAAGAPQGYAFTMLLTVSAANGFRRTFDIPWYVGLPTWRTHDLGGIALTVTDQGIIGYMSNAGSEGRGLSYQNGAGLLYIGSFWAGTDANYVCNRDYSGNGVENYEWQVTTTPNGRVKDLGHVSADRMFQSVFSDAGHASPKPLVVEQTSMSFAMPQNDRFVILEYHLTNNGPVALPALYNGVFCDFDIGNSMANLGGADPSRNLTYMYEAGGPYCGIALIGITPATNLTLIDNVTYVYPTSSINDTYKIRHLKGTISTPVATTPADLSALTSSNVSLPANGGQAVVAYAIVYGATLADLQDATDAANVLYSPVAPVTAEVPVKVLHLGANHPNPFNPATTFDYALAADGRVVIEVFDLAGRRVRTLVDEPRAAGKYTATWDGKDDAGERTASGTYFCRMTSGGHVASSKMTLVK